MGPIRKPSGLGITEPVSKSPGKAPEACNYPKFGSGLIKSETPFDWQTTLPNLDFAVPVDVVGFRRKVASWNRLAELFR